MGESTALPQPTSQRDEDPDRRNWGQEGNLAAGVFIGGMHSSNNEAVW